MSFKISDEGYSFLDAVAVGESEPAGTSRGYGYDKLFGNTVAHPVTFEGYTHFPQWAGVRVGGSMTHAAGRYQFEPATWQWVSAALQLPDFSPESQDEAAWYLALHDYNRRTKRNLAKDLEAGEASWIVEGLNKTWTSINEHFYSRYDRAWDLRTASKSVSAPLPSCPISSPTPAPAQSTTSLWDRLRGLFG